MPLNRREWIAGVVLAGAAAGQQHRFTKSICSVIFAPGTGLRDMFRLAKSAGFEAIELRLGVDIPMFSSGAVLAGIRKDAHNTGIEIASLWVSQPLSAHPLNSPDAGERALGVAAIKRATEIGATVGCGALLLVPGRVGSGPTLFAGYEETWQRFSEELAKCIPAAAGNKVLLTIENVWNKFLLSPLEMRSFVDQFHSPWFAAHFDTGNVMQFGYPEDWIHTLGARIKRVHLKDFKLSTRAEQGRFVPLLEGDVDFAAVIKAFGDVGYTGFLSPEIDYDAGQLNQLSKVAAQLDKILSLG